MLAQTCKHLDEWGRMVLFLDRKTYRALAQNLPLITQFGISLVAPLLLAMWGAGWLQRRFGLGSWVMLVAVALGLGGMFSSFLRFVRYVEKQAKRDQQEEEE